MLDPRAVADHLDETRAALARRSPEAAASLEGIVGLAEERRTLIGATESRAARRNQANQAMSGLAKGGDKAAFEERRSELKALSAEIKELEERLRRVESDMESLLAAVPNVPHSTAPDGTGEADNVVVRTWGEPPKLDFGPKAHWEIGEALGIFDFARAAKLSGARFSVLSGHGARLSRALVACMLDLHTLEHGYLEIAPPYRVKASALYGTGQLPKFEADLC
jgi:seryl-tRNA synthetase